MISIGGKIITCGMVALDQGHFKVAFFLARSEGWTPLHKAAYVADPDRCREVLRDGLALVSDKSSARETAVQVASSVAKSLLEQVQGTHDEEDETKRQRALETIQVLEDAAQPWKPRHNLLFPPEFRRMVASILMMRRTLSNVVALRKRPISELPLELWHMILAWIPHDAFSEEREECSRIQSKVAEITGPGPQSILAVAATAVSNSTEITE